MNGIISKKTDLREYYKVENAEFTGVFSQGYYNVYKKFYKRLELREFYKVHKYYHLFIKYGDKVYMEVDTMGWVVIPFDKLQKHKYWKQYYDLSLILTNDKHTVIKNNPLYNELSNNKPYEELERMFRGKYWTIDTAFIEYKNFVEYDTLIKKDIDVVPSGNVCHYDINPFNLEHLEYTEPEKLKIFEDNYMLRYDIRDEKIITEKMMEFNKLAAEYLKKKHD
jgi:hypothetical protein